jgi:hypothetical protein
MTDVTIISELAPGKEEAGLVQEVMARPDKRRVVALQKIISLGFPNNN